MPQVSTKGRGTTNFDPLQWFAQLGGQPQLPAGAGGNRSGAGGMNKPGLTTMTSPEQQFNPYQEGVAKALKKAGEAHVLEAIQQGVSPDHISEQAGVNPQNPMQILSGLLGAQPAEAAQTPVNDLGKISIGMNPMSAGQPQQPQQIQQPQMAQQPQQQNNPMSLLAGLFQPTPADQLRTAQTKAINQEMAGDKPLQKGEREKIGLEAQNTFFNNIATASAKTPSGQEATLIGNLDSGLKQIDLLSKELEANPNVFKEFTMPGNPKREAINTMLDDITDIIGRLRSQGSLTAGEEKRYLAQVPKKGLKAVMESPKTAKFKLDKIKSLFSDIRTTVTPRTTDFANKVNQLLQMGATREQIYKVYNEGGL